MLDLEDVKACHPSNVHGSSLLYSAIIPELLWRLSTTINLGILALIHWGDPRVRLLGKHTFKSSSYRLNGGFENIAIITIVMALFPMQSVFDHFWSGLSIFYVILSLRPLVNSRSSQSRPFATAPTDISTHWQREWLSVCTSNFVAWKSQDQQILRMLVFF